MKRNLQATDEHSQSRRSRDRPETLDRAPRREVGEKPVTDRALLTRVIANKRHYHDYGRQHVICQTDYHHQDSRVDYRGCYNCGLMNHNKSTCYHRERLRCNNCDRFLS